MLTSIDTLTIRRHGDRASFLLHRRDPRSVAVAGGTLAVIPCGVFQPVGDADRAADFDLWRGVMREYAEELIGQPEHRAPVRYDRPPLVLLDDARRGGRARPWCLGIALDALTLVAEILTVVVFDAPTFDQLFGAEPAGNAEVSPVVGYAFTAEVVDGLCASGRLSPATAGCLRLAWRHQATIVGRRRSGLAPD